MKRILHVLIIFLILLIAAMLLVQHSGREINARQVVAPVASLSLMLFWLTRDGKFTEMLRNALIWLSIFLAFVVVYSYKTELGFVGDRVLATLNPGRSYSNEYGEQVFYINDNGHFEIECSINDVKILTLLDTGASSLAISVEDAKRLGIDVSQLQFKDELHTANGVTLGAPVTIPKLVMGNIFIENVSAMVTNSGLNQPLLGMSVLSKLKKFQIEGNRLIMVGRSRGI